MVWEKKHLIEQKRKGDTVIMMKEYTKQVLHDAVVQHLLTDAQPVPKEQPPPPGQPLLSQAVTAWWWTPNHHLVERWLSLPAFACPFSQQVKHPRDHPRAHLPASGFEGKALLHRLGQGTLTWSLLPAEPGSQLMFSTNRYRIIFPHPLLIRTFLLFPMVDQQELLWSSSFQNLCSGAFGRGKTASSMRITSDSAISVAHISAAMMCLNSISIWQADLLKWLRSFLYTLYGPFCCFLILLASQMNNLAWATLSVLSGEIMFTLKSGEPT